MQAAPCSGYYNGSAFHRLVPDFILQGGDPTGTGQGGESIYGKPFKVNLRNQSKSIDFPYFRMNFISGYGSIVEDCSEWLVQVDRYLNLDIRAHACFL